MQYTVLGRCGIRVSAMGLGCGGPSRLGRKKGMTEEQSADVVRRALDLGVNFLDTAESYGTEGFIGLAIRSFPRDQVVLSTKKTVSRQGVMTPPDQVAPSLEKSLSRLGTDHVDVLHMHNVRPHEYTYVLEQLVPEAVRLREQGKIRALGITEDFEGDSGHSMLQRALQDDCWDVFMLGYNVVNQSARQRIFPITQQRGIATLNMYALRHLRNGMEHLRHVAQRMVDEGRMDPALLGDELREGGQPLGFLLGPEGAGSLVEAAVRFARHEPGVTVVLTGTGNAEHVAANVPLFDLPPLPPEHLARLRSLFERVDHIS